MMENLKSAEKLETGKSELEHGSELYHKLKKLEEKEWIYQDYINTIAQKEASFRLKWEDSEEKHDQIRKKFIEAEKRAEQAIAEKEVFAEKNKELEKLKSDLLWNLTQNSMNSEALAAAEGKIVELDRELAANEMKIKEFQVAMEVTHREKEGLFKELEATKSQLQIKLQELQRKNEDISGENNRLTQELAANQTKIKESQLAMEVTHREKERLLKELEATESQLQIKEKELEVALNEKDMVQSMLDTMQLQENEREHIVQPLRNRRRRKKNKMKRATSSSIKWATSSSIRWVLGAAVVLSVFIVGIFLLRTRYYAS